MEELLLLELVTPIRSLQIRGGRFGKLSYMDGMLDIPIKLKKKKQEKRFKDVELY